MDLILPYASEGIKILGAPIGNQHFEEEQFKNFETKIEYDLSLLQQPILTPAHKIVDILHQHQATLLSLEQHPLEPQLQ